MISQKEISVQNTERVAETNEISSHINQYVTIKYSNAVLAMLCISVSIASILLFIQRDSGYLGVISGVVAFVALITAFLILKRSKKISNSNEIHISSDKRVK